MKKHRITFFILTWIFSTLLLHAATPFLPTNYDEPYRGQFHFSQQSGWMNDINGIWLQNGVYNLTYQAYTNSLDGGPKSWGRATSTDMINWTQLSNALDPGVNVPGDCWSGSTVIDVNNTSGFGSIVNPPLVTIYTATSKGTCLAYSIDQGVTWVAYAGNPVNVGGTNSDTRDPKVFWYAPTSKWVCVLYENGFTFYSSTDLKTWTKNSNFGAGWGYECPDFFEIAVDGGTVKKWVLVRADSQYYIGTFNGTTFTPDAGGPYTMVNNSGIGGGFYASQTYFQNNFPGGRVIQLAWMSGMGPGSTAPWTHNSTFPCEVKLETFPEGVRASRIPISEISNQYGTTQTWAGQTLRAGQNLFAGKLSKCFDIEAVFDVSDASATAVTFQFANKVITYDLTNKTLFGNSLVAINNQVKIRFLVDWGELEAFGNDGQFSYAENFKFTPSNSSVSMTANGNIQLVSARYSTINRIWSGTPNNGYVNDTDAANNYNGSWNAFSGEGGYYNSDGHWSNTAGNYLEYAFTGTQVSWYGLKNNDLGMAAVYIDGVLAQDNIDCYSNMRIVQQLFTKTGLPNGNHTIKVVVKGTHNPSSSGYALVHDYFGFIGTPATPSAADDATVGTTYNGTWVTDVNPLYYNTTCHVSNTINSDFQYTFTGSQVFWYGLKNDDLGMATVYIDGVMAADNIDCYSTTKAVNMLFSKTNLSNGSHTIKVVVKGTKNPSSSGTAIVHDYFDFPEVPLTIIDDASAINVYNGEWRTVANEDGYYNRTCHVGTSANGAVEATFTGTQISWYALKNNDLGKATVYIDGVVAQDDIDCYSNSREVNLMFSKNGLSNGSHTIKVLIKGTKNPSSSGIALVHDFFSVFVPISQAITVTGDLTFGSVGQADAATKTLIVSNTSNTALVVSNLDLPVGFTANWTSGTIAVGAYQEVIITFVPTEIKTYSGMIVVNANAGIESIAVTGTGIVVTALNDILGIKMQLSPNPVLNKLTIVAKEAYKIVISDISGKVYISKEMLGTTAFVDMSDYPNGIFILKATNTKGEILVRKLLKN